MCLVEDLMEVHWETTMVEVGIFALVLIVVLGCFEHLANVVPPHLPENLFVYHIFPDFFYSSWFPRRGRIFKTWWDLTWILNIVLLIVLFTILILLFYFLVIYVFVPHILLLLLLMKRKFSIILVIWRVLLFLELLECCSQLLILFNILILKVRNDKLFIN